MRVKLSQSARLHILDGRYYVRSSFPVHLCGFRCSTEIEIINLDHF